MSIDQTFTFGVTGATTEAHIGAGANATAAGPADKPIVPPKSPLPAGRTTPLDVTVGSSHLRNPA
jgi:hypothetical protein